MNSIIFENMYQRVIQDDYGSNTKLTNRLLNFGGKDKLRQILFDAEKILTVAEAWKSSKGFASFMASLALDDILVLTNRRLLFLGKRMFGTLVTEVPLKKAMSSMKWRNNNLHIEVPEEELDIYVTDDCVDKVKAVLYGDYTEADYNEKFKSVAKSKNSSIVKPKINEIFDRNLKAANAGDSLAMMELFVAYDKGIDVEKNSNKAFNWLIKAAEAGNANAMFEISCQYLLGDKVKQNAKKSLEWCLKAVENGHIIAMILLAYAYSSVGEEDGYVKACSEYFKSTKKIDLRSVTLSGNHLVEYNLEKAIILMEKISEKNYEQSDECLLLLIERVKKEIAQNSAKLSVVKGQRVDLTKMNPAVKNLLIGLGWRAADGFDIDSEAFLLCSKGKVINETDFVFYNNSFHDSKLIEHLGEKTADGVNEQFRVTIDKIPPTVAKVVFTITLHEAAQRKQTFGQVQDIFIKLADEASGKEILRYDLGKNFFSETAIVVAEIYRYKGEWKFNAVGSGFSGGLAALCKNFGMDIVS